MKVASIAKDDEVSRRLREDDYCREVLYDLVSSFGYGQKSFNKPGYVALMLDKFRGKPRFESQERIEAAFKFYEKHGLVVVTERGIDINKEKVPKYVPRNLRS